jgi:lipoprotein-releasing system permease protein
MYIWKLCGKYMTTRYTALASVASILLGVATLIVVNSVMTGFHVKMQERLHGILSDIVVEARAPMTGFPSPELIMDRIKASSIGDRIEGMTPAIETLAILTYKPKGYANALTRPVQIVGIDPKGRCEVGDFASHLVNKANQAQPSFDLREDALEWRRANPDIIDQDETWPSAIIGYQIATFRSQGMNYDEYLVYPGNEVIVTTVANGDGGRPEPKSYKFIVNDLYKSGMSEYDDRYMFVPLDALQKVCGMQGRANTIQIKLKDYADAPMVVESLRKLLPQMVFIVNTWEDKQGPLLYAVKVELFLINLTLFFIIAVAGFGILATFSMMVIEKTRDIGLLKALGASSGGVTNLFLVYGLALGLIGALAGTLIGITLTLNLNDIEKIMADLTGHEIFPRDIYYFDEIPILLRPQMVVWVVTGSLMIAIAAAVYPARRAARLQPVETLRYE